jgi:hypothetical protein
MVRRRSSATRSASRYVAYCALDRIMFAVYAGSSASEPERLSGAGAGWPPVRPHAWHNNDHWCHGSTSAVPRPGKPEYMRWSERVVSSLMSVVRAAAVPRMSSYLNRAWPSGHRISRSRRDSL